MYNITECVNRPLQHITASNHFFEHRSSKRFAVYLKNVSLIRTTMVSVRFFVECVFFSLTFSLIWCTVAAMRQSDFDDEDMPGGRICTDDEEFDENIRQMVCNSMLQHLPNETPDPSCENVTLKMLNASNQSAPFTRYTLVCKHNGSTIGCACAGSSYGQTVGMSWDGYACS